jgi:hypothetical protein
MQTNAPATGEWVDQYNRAVQYGQITTGSVITPGSLNPDVINGTALTYSSTGIRTLACWNNVEFVGVAQYGSLGTPKDVFGNTFVLPSNTRCIADIQYAIVRTLTGTVSTNPQVRLYVGGTTINSGNQATTTLQLSNTFQLGGTVPADGVFLTFPTIVSPGKAFANGGTTPQLIVTTALNGPTSYKVDVFASFIVLPAAV